MSRAPSPQVRLYAILARKSAKAVVFRRGPSKQVLLISWDTSNDTFKPGQWFKGRIYERRCDLSPDGELLLYFAAKYRGSYSWSAVSKPPYLTALAMWPKGDCWGGGGEFITRHRIALNHRDSEMNLAHGLRLPKLIRIEQFGERPGWGEDDPIWSARLQRDAWELVSYPTKTKDELGSRVSWEPDPPIKWHKPHPKFPTQYSLEMEIVGIHERDGPWYLTEHSVIDARGKVERLGRSEWADWSRDGDLLFAIGSKLYRAKHDQGHLSSLEDASVIADFSDLKFENREAPYESGASWK